MKFRREKEGNKKKEEILPAVEGFPIGTESFGGVPGLSQKEALKHLKNLEKQRVKPLPCPFIEKCEFLMIPSVGATICLDRELGPKHMNQGYMAHMHGHHVWESCKVFAERKRKEKGVLPKDLVETLKKLSEEKNKKQGL